MFYKKAGDDFGTGSGAGSYINRIEYLLIAVMGLYFPACVSPPPAFGNLTDNVKDWRDEIIYQVMIDRFADSDSSNDYNVNLSDPSAYHGGDWKGLISKLDYLQTLGITAIWISPVVRNVEEDAGFSSYHGYWAQDLTRTNPHFGDISALKELVDDAHARGIKVILDIVTNHVGQVFFYDINKNGVPDEFFIGQGGKIIPIGQEGDTSDLVRVTEWDPDFNINGIQAWTSLGPSGEAPVVFVHDPSIDRVPPYPPPLDKAYAYNRKGRVTVWTKPQVCGCESWGCPWNNKCRREQEVLGDFPGGLKDLDTTRQDVRNALFWSYSRWVDIADFDAFRIDTLKHVEPEFFDDFCHRMRQHLAARGKHNFFMFGEAFDGDDNLLGSYTKGQGVDSVFYFSQYYTVFRGALMGDGQRTCEIERLHCRRLGCISDPCGEGGAIASVYGDQGKTGGVTDGDTGDPLNSRQVAVNFISNHDVGRLLFFMPGTWSETTKRKTLHLALAYMMTEDGIPCLYYGVEQEFSGGNDPANRETMWDPASYTKQVWKDGRWQDARRTYDSDQDGLDDTVWLPFDTGNPTFKFIQKLIRIRKDHEALRRGNFTVRWSTRTADGPDKGIFAFERTYHDQTMLIVMNLSLKGESETRSNAVSMSVNFSPGQVLTDLLDPGSMFTVTDKGCEAGNGCLDVKVPARGIRILSLE
ncbi:MAG: alpha-amylase [Deltaproteobacteria bacterium]|nr:alpha-amylase [Deltaproteobacteria bacterium]